MIIFDTETTDLMKSPELPDSVQPRIIELYALKLDDNTLDVVGEFDQLMDPGFTISEDIQRITRITPDMLVGKRGFAAHLPELQELWLGERFTVGHNVMFDLDMLYSEVKRQGKVARFPWSPQAICTVEATEHLQGRRLNLTDLHKHLFGEPFESAHRAKADVEATCRCLKELIKRGELRLR